MATFENFTVTVQQLDYLAKHRIELYKNDDGSYKINFIGDNQAVTVNFRDKEQIVNLKKILPNKA